MSILAILSALEKEGRLLEYHGHGRVMPDPDEVGSRSLWLTPQVDQMLESSDVHGRTFRPGPLHALFVSFISGKPMHVGEKGQMKWLTPKSEGIVAGTWRGVPGVRALGGFICRDCAVVIDMHERGDLTPYKKYEEKRRAALSEWNVLFPDVKPLDGTDPDKCLTNWTAV